MEGHRHEKVGIVICAYIIGFTTAFIGFGINSLQKTEVENELIVDPVVKVADVDQTKIQKNVITSISFGDDGLYAVTPAGNILLSVNKSVLDASVIGATRNSGYYFSIVDAEASRNGKFAYFCEQLMESDTTCDPFVYDLQGDILHKVLKDGTPLSIEVALHASAWDEAGKLSVNGNSSASEGAPWSLIPQPTENVEVTEATQEEPENIDSPIEEGIQVQ